MHKAFFARRKGEGPRSELAEIGMDMARAARRQALAQAALAELALALKAKFLADRDAAAAQAAAEQAKRAARARSEHTARQKARVKHAIEQAIEAEGDDGFSEEDLEKLRVERDELLENDDIVAALAECPVSEIIIRVSRYIGLQPDWIRWQDEPWAVAEMRTKPPGSPYADYRPPRAGGERGEGRKRPRPPHIAATGSGPP